MNLKCITTVSLTNSVLQRLINLCLNCKHCLGFILSVRDKSIQATWILNINADVYPYI